MTVTSIQLRIKIISLADEARHIRRWENRLKKAARGRGTGENPERPELKEAFWSLREHRQCVVSTEARYSILAHGFLRGKPYKVLEQRRYSDPYWVRVEEIARKFGGNAYDKDAFTAWRAAAGEPDQRFPSNRPPQTIETVASPAPAPKEAPRKKVFGIF